MNRLKDSIGEITGIYTEALEVNESLIDLGARFAHMPGTVLLMSGGESDCARYDILGILPWLSFWSRGKENCLQIRNRDFRIRIDPFDLLRQILQVCDLKSHNLPEPMSAGLMGYLAYDLKDLLEELPRTSVDDLGLPHIWLTAPSLTLIHDRIEQSTRIHIPQFAQRDLSETREIRDNFYRVMSGPQPETGSFSGDVGGFGSPFSRSAYMEAVEQIREYIAAGHVYQVNMSQRFEMGFEGNPFALFKTLFQRNPAPFFAFINAGDHQIVSTSPERFILRKGPKVETRPINGTRPRGKTAIEDQRLGAELLAAVKDQAELSMIVDLLRNDIGKVCRPGSVRVAEHKRLEKYRNVFHLVSIVEGELAAGRDSTDLIRAAFPGGSITGCPKIRSMEIIDELEPVRRHIYTGSIGYISFHDTLDLSIAIRTATVFNGRIFFSVGGGVVYDSIPADEYEETLHKGRTLMTVFKGLSEDVPKPSPNTAFVWFNGRLRPVQEACIPLSHPGFQYGYGFFETLRADNGVCRYVEEHIARLNRSWKAFMETEPPDLSWPEILSQVICKNRLENQTAAVKIIVAKGDRDKAPFTHTLAVTARPYVHRLIEKKKPGLDILTYPHPRFSPLADHKTLNYLYYLQAGQWAAKQGADEALIVNPDGTVSETNTANLLILGPDKTLIVPESAHVLPGVMRHIVCNLLENQGWKVIRRPVLPEELTSTGPVILTNSLMGAVWVRSLNNISCPAFSDNFLYELNRQMGISLTDNL